MVWQCHRYLLLLAVVLLPVSWAFSCDGSCSGHGACDSATGRCQCFPGYVGATCKSQACPKGAAWADYASATDVAHALAECSNMGSCDRTSGVCKCVSGFEGAACERMSCPPCVNGRCITLRDAATLKDGTNFVASPTTYNVWDADKIVGCQCDIGFTGFDCSLRECPRGDDPMTTTQTASEVQHLNCLCDSCTGSFALTFRRRTTRNLLPSETAASLKAALEALDSIVQVTVTIAPDAAGLTPPEARTVCDADGATTSITFTHNPGNLPPLQVQNQLTGGGTTPVLTLSAGNLATGLYDGVGAAVDGTRENVYCSNRGVCDFTTGVCTCTTGFTSSDGSLGGAAGPRGDCGSGTATACPATANGACDGPTKGTCSNAPTWTCVCNAGFAGADCSLRTCPRGIAWFDEPTAPGTAHALAECSNKGKCDTKTGLCACQPPFTGAACDVLNCPAGANGQLCSGHGTCRSMQQLALAATNSDGDSLGVTYGNTLNVPATWDANRIYGCDCTAIGYSYMGAYSTAFGEFRDFDCGSRFCPVGADPYEADKVNEIQSLSCQADGGSFTLTFRRQTTAAIAFNANAATLKTALEALSSITSVGVVINGGGTAVCTAGAVAGT
jgi:hypothetical protein